MPKIYYDVNGSPIYDQKDGWKNYDEFASAAQDDLKRINKLQKYGPVEMKAGPTSGITGNTIGTTVASALPFAGGLAGEVIGPEGAVAGAGLGTLAKNYLRGNWPQTFGQNPSGLGRVADVGTDLLGGAAPGLIGPLMRGAGNATKIASGILGSKASKVVSSAIDAIPSLSPKTAEALKLLIGIGGAEVKNPNN